MEDRRSDGSYNRAHAAIEASKCDAPGDPLDGPRDRILPHHDPPHLGDLRAAAASLGDLQALERSLFANEIRDIVGLYLPPLNGALLLSVEEKPQIQALDREQPVLPMMPSVPERRTHSYIQPGTTSLLAALDIAPFMIGKCYKRHGRPNSSASSSRLTRVSFPISTSTSSWKLTRPTKPRLSEHG